jgi:hypothetical protein
VLPISVATWNFLFIILFKLLFLGFSHFQTFFERLLWELHEDNECVVHNGTFFVYSTIYTGVTFCTKVSSTEQTPGSRKNSTVYFSWASITRKRRTIRSHRDWEIKRLLGELRKKCVIKVGDLTQITMCSKVDLK